MAATPLSRSRLEATSEWEVLVKYAAALRRDWTQEALDSETFDAKEKAVGKLEALETFFAKLDEWDE